MKTRCFPGSLSSHSSCTWRAGWKAPGFVCAAAFDPKTNAPTDAVSPAIRDRRAHFSYVMTPPREVQSSRSLLHALECEPPRQRVVPGSNRSLCRAENQPPIFEPEKALLLGADIVRAPRGFDLENDAARTLIDDARPRVGNVSGEERRLHALADRPLAANERGRVTGHDLHVAGAAFDDDRADGCFSPGIARHRTVGADILGRQEFPPALDRLRAGLRRREGTRQKAEGKTQNDSGAGRGHAFCPSLLPFAFPFTVAAAVPSSAASVSSSDRGYRPRTASSADTSRPNSAPTSRLPFRVQDSTCSSPSCRRWRRW